MDKYSMFMDRKTQHHQDVSSSPLDPQILNAIAIKFLACYFEDINKLILEFIWRGKKTQIANWILKNKTRTLPDFMTRYIAT